MKQLVVRSKVTDFVQAEREAHKHFDYYHPNCVFDIENVTPEGVTFSLVQDASKKIYFSFNVGFDLKSLPKRWQKILSDLIPTKAKNKKLSENDIIPDIKKDDILPDLISDDEEE